MERAWFGDAFIYCRGFVGSRRYGIFLFLLSVSLQIIKGKPNESKPDMLESLFEMQAKLNNHTFAKHGINRPGEFGNSDTNLPMNYLKANAKEIVGKLVPNSFTNEWLRKYLEALNAESKELGDELLWKWWSKDHLDMQNIRVEIVDILHFWISLSITSGFSCSLWLGSWLYDESDLCHWWGGARKAIHGEKRVRIDG